MEQELYYIMAAAKPCADNPECTEYAGAYVNCFLKASDEREAKHKMQQFLAAEGWELLGIDTLHKADREQYAQDPEMSRCFDEAEKHGECGIFYTWENEDSLEEQHAEK